MSRFIAADGDNAYLLRPSVNEWRPQDHRAHFVVEVIEQMDLNELVRRYDIPLPQRFAQEAPTPQTCDPVVQIAHRLGTHSGPALYGLRKKPVEPVFIRRVMRWRQRSMGGRTRRAAIGFW